MTGLWICIALLFVCLVGLLGRVEKLEDKCRRG